MKAFQLWTLLVVFILVVFVRSLFLMVSFKFVALSAFIELRILVFCNCLLLIMSHSLHPCVSWDLPFSLVCETWCSFILFPCEGITGNISARAKIFYCRLLIRLEFSIICFRNVYLPIKTPAAKTIGFVISLPPFIVYLFILFTGFYSALAPFLIVQLGDWIFNLSVTCHLESILVISAMDFVICFSIQIPTWIPTQGPCPLLSMAKCSC